jgi:hypothetical protein
MTNKFSSSITLTNNNNNDTDILKKIDMKYINYVNDTELYCTTYNNIINNNGDFFETFNKLHKDHNNNIYEKIGNSSNKNNWTIKEFFNQILDKQYTASYNDNNFDDLLISCLSNNNIIENNTLIK